MNIHPANVVMTAHVAYWTEDRADRTRWLLECLTRHNTGDWGDLDPDDIAVNNHALRHRTGRLLSVYTVPAAIVADTNTDDTIWIITDDLDDPDTATTILWPSDY